MTLKFKTVTLVPRFGTKRKREPFLYRLIYVMPYKVVLVGIGLLIFTFLLNLLPNSEDYLSLSYLPSLFLVILGIALIWIMPFLARLFNLSQDIWARTVIMDFLNKNKLYKEVVVEVKPRKKKKLIESSASVSYCIDKEEGFLRVRVNKTGIAEYDRFMNDSADLLVAAFNRDLWNVYDGNNFKEFQLLLKPLSRYTLTNGGLLDKWGNYVPTNEVGRIPIAEKITWDYRRNPHALIAGGTGSGKTYFIFYLIRCMLEQGAKLYVIDPKRADLKPLMGNFIDEKDIAETPGQIAGVLRRANDEMNKRYESFKDFENYNEGNDFTDYGLAPIFIIFDEVAAARAEADKKTAKEIDDYLKQIVMKGRQAGVFVVLTTQQPNAQTISTDVRDQLGLRVGLGTMSSEGERMVFGSFEGELTSSGGNGEGHVFLDGQHWLSPKKFSTPFFHGSYSLKNDLRNLLS